ncbi:MAG: AMP-binding protein [Eubacteriales bacterium]
MRYTGLIKISFLEMMAKRMPREKIMKLQKQRFEKLVAFSRENSPFYKELYKGLGENPDLASLPVTTKSILMASFDDWVTEPGISLEKVNDFLHDKDNIGRKLDKKCTVSLTSGSTGIPCKVLTDKGYNNLAMALYFVRTMRFFEMVKICLRGGKYFLIANKEFSISYNIQRAQILYTYLNKFRCASIGVNTLAEDTIKAINKFKPAILFSYPTAMELLMPLIKKNALDRSPDIIILGGERCSCSLLKQMRSCMTSHVINTYGSSESGLVACECREGHLHIYSDWTIVEPVDNNYNPVPPGVLSDKILITNLNNYSQPFIRYEIDDRVIYHDEPCACGSVLPFLEVEGRTDDILEFDGKSGKVGVSPITLTDPSEIDGILRYQIIQKRYDLLELRLMCEEGYSKQEISLLIQEKLLVMLKNMGVDGVSIVLSGELPECHPTSGKFKMIVRMPDAVYE